jgi:hypothetical protein
MTDAETSNHAPTAPPRGDRGFQLVLIIACIALAALVLLLAWQNRQLKEELASVSTMQMPPKGLAAGDLFPSLVLLEEGGEPTTLEFGEDEPRRLLLVFSTQCPACRDTLPIWNSLLENPPSGVQVAGIQLGGATDEFPFLPFPVFTPEDGGASLAGKIPYVPATLIVDPGGRIEQIWYGLLDEPSQQALGEALGSHE